MEDAAEFARYLTGGSWESGKEGSLPNLELLAYAKKAFPKETNGSLTYEENGKTKEVEPGRNTVCQGVGSVRRIFIKFDRNRYLNLASKMTR